MQGHVFPKALAAALLVAFAAPALVPAQDGSTRDEVSEDDGARPAPARDDASPQPAEEPAPPSPPAVGEPFPQSLPLTAMPGPGDDGPAPAGTVPATAGDPSSSAGAAAGDGEASGDGEVAQPGGDAEIPELPSVSLAELARAGTQPGGAEDEPPPARPVVLVFWSSRCVVCRRYAEILSRLSKEFGERAALVLVASGAEETPENVRAALAAEGLRLPVVLDTERAAAQRLGVRVTPTAFLVDSKGALRYRGPVDDDRRARSRDARELLRPAVLAVLDGKDVETSDVRPFGCAVR